MGSKKHFFWVRENGTTENYEKEKGKKYAAKRFYSS